MDEQTLLKTFEFNLKIERMRLKLTQEDIAEKINSTKVYISNIENAKHNLSLLNAYKLAKSVNKTIEELLKIS